MSERLFLRLDGDPPQGTETNAPGDTLQSFVVGAELSQHVSHILLYRETLPSGCEVLERVVPDGSVRLVFNLGDAPSVGEGAGLPVEAIGASTQPALVRLRQRMEGLSVTLRPGAASALLDIPAGELAGSAVPLDELWGADAAEALERLAAEPDTPGRLAVLHAILQRRLRRTQPSPCPAALRAARLISAAGGRQKLREVAESIGVGERRLQQLFHTHVGLSPRAWSRLSRLHHCLRALRLEQEPRWAELALRSGFYDQSHLANEFRALCGLTPTEFFGAVHVGSGSSKTAR
jgi:AraC-like DNA-binding protein